MHFLRALGIVKTSFFRWKSNQQVHRMVGRKVQKRLERFFPCRASLWSESKSYDCHLSSKSQSASYSAGDVIPKNSNLNDYIQPGVYRIESSSEASTIKNLPDGVATGCRIEVSVAGTGWIRQCLYPNNNTNIYIRVTANNYSFSSPWYVLRPSALT